MNPTPPSPNDPTDPTDDTAALNAASEPYGAGPAEAARALLIDVRRAPAYERAATLIPGARWHDPAHLQAWIDTLPTDRPVVVYCVHGHEVSRGAALRLRAAGVDARFLRGGIEGWQAAGLPLQTKEVTR